MPLGSKRDMNLIPRTGWDQKTICNRRGALASITLTGEALQVPCLTYSAPSSNLDGLKKCCSNPRRCLRVAKGNRRGRSIKRAISYSSTMAIVVHSELAFYWWNSSESYRATRDTHLTTIHTLLEFQTVNAKPITLLKNLWLSHLMITKWNTYAFHMEHTYCMTCLEACTPKCKWSNRWF